MHMHPVHKEVMTLSEYLSKSEESDAAFAARVGLSQSQISRLRRLRSLPSWEAIKAIATATGNDVTAADWADAERIAPPAPKAQAVA